MPNVLSKFNKLFNISSNVEDAQRDFINRVNLTILDLESRKYGYEEKFKLICYQLGENAEDRIRVANRGIHYGEDTIPGLRSLTDDDFIKTLRILVSLYSISKNEPETQKGISNFISLAMDNSAVDLGISWKEGMFYPSGAKKLDMDLIEEPFEWLGAFTEVKEDFKKALSSYFKKDYPATIDHCYLTVEGLARQVLNNTKVIKNNFDELLKTMDLSPEWKSILNKWYEFANEYKRHASTRRNNLTKKETEAFLYLTGIFVRLILEK